MRSKNRFLFICAASGLIGVCMAFVAQLLLRLIAAITGLAFYGRLAADATPAGNHLGWWVVLVPVVGAVIVGFIARHGSEAIRGHGIPEAMEQVLLNKSRIPARVLFLKPISAAIAIGTGGPFGAEGPIIATGGSFGSLVGQFLETTPLERKVLLAAGASAGMAATFGTPISAVILAVELLLFEFHSRSLIPVAVASAVAAGLRQWLVGGAACFPMPVVPPPAAGAFGAYMLLGACVGVLAVIATRSVYLAEEAFDRLPFHWMWWPAVGAVAVGVLGVIEPRTLGVGYENISDILSGKLLAPGPARLGLLKFTSWVVALASGTSGGTLAPLLTVGAASGTVLAKSFKLLLPAFPIDVPTAALVGMASIFAGASGALLASVVFVLEATLQANAVVPLLAGCTTSYLVSRMLMRHTIMTEKIAKRGVRVPHGYTADLLDRVVVSEAATSPAVCLEAADRVGEVRARLSSARERLVHQGYPVVDLSGRLVGLVTLRELLDPRSAPERPVSELVRRAPVVISERASLREAVRLMLAEGVGRLCVVADADRDRVTGILTRRDVLAAYRHDEETAPRELALLSRRV